MLQMREISNNIAEDIDLNSERLSWYWLTISLESGERMNHNAAFVQGTGKEFECASTA